jgi:hypothetical protein
MYEYMCTDTGFRYYIKAIKIRPQIYCKAVKDSCLFGGHRNSFTEYCVGFPEFFFLTKQEKTGSFYCQNEPLKVHIVQLLHPQNVRF